VEAKKPDTTTVTPWCAPLPVLAWFSPRSFTFRAFWTLLSTNSSLKSLIFLLLSKSFFRKLHKKSSISIISPPLDRLEEEARSGEARA